jgi:hypothetical protein
MPGVVSYKVGVTRSHKRGPSRWLSVQLEAEAGSVQSVSLFFYEGAVPSLGFLNRETSLLTANLPAADFEPTYQILNTEKPVYVHYRVHGDENRLLSLDISTSEEPIGEGPVDMSP